MSSEKPRRRIYAIRGTAADGWVYVLQRHTKRAAMVAVRAMSAGEVRRYQKSVAFIEITVSVYRFHRKARLVLV